jgi:transmembrane sensor
MRQKIPWAYIAGTAAALLLTLGLWSADRAGFGLPEFVRGSGESPVTEYTTAQAIDREVHLADGSILRLGGASTVRVTYSTAHRNVELRRGEAYFEVQHDAARPFVVRAGAATVTAVGTAFNVRTDGGRIVVAVSEGVVEVVPRPAHAGGGLSSVRASSGQQVTLDHVSTHAAYPTLAVQLSDAPPSDDWREGMLVFVDEPLRRVVARVNRYSRPDIVLADDATGELRFTGTVLRDSIEDWVKGLEGAFAVHAQTHPDGSIALRSSAGMR